MPQPQINYNLFKRKKDEKTYDWYYSFTDPITGIRKQKRCKGCRTLKEARIFLDNLSDQVNSVVFFKDIATNFYDPKGTFNQRKISKGYELKKATLYRKDVLLRGQILPKWGEVPLSKMKPRIIEGWLDKVDCSNETKNHIVFAMKEIFDSAMLDGYVDSNPMDSFPRYRSVAKEKEVLTDEEIEQCFPLDLFQLRDLYQTMDLGVCFALMVSSGLRMGEAIALTWKGVDFERGGILVFQQWSKHDGIEAPKKNEYRSIVVPEKIMSLLSEFKKTKGKVDDDDFVFLSPFGKHLDNNHFTILTKSIENQIGKHITPHCLRHTYNTKMRNLMLENGIPEEVLRSFTGHRSVEMTDYYDHPELTKKLDALKNYKDVIDKF